MQLSLPAAGADFAGLLPVFGSLQVGIPEGPGSTLAWPCIVDLALARLVVEEDAIAIGVFFETFPPTFHPHVFSFEFDEITLADYCGDGSDLFLIYPHKTGRPSAAIAALSAVETEAVGIPRLSHNLSSYFPGSV